MGFPQVLEQALQFCIGFCQSGLGVPTGPRPSSRRKRPAERAPGAILLLGAAGGPPRPFQHPTMPNHMGPEPSPLPASGPWSAAAMMQELWVVRFLGIIEMVK